MFDEILNEVADENATPEQLRAAIDKIVGQAQTVISEKTQLEEEKGKLEGRIGDLQKINHDYFTRLHGSTLDTVQANQTKEVTEEDIHNILKEMTGL